MTLAAYQNAFRDLMMTQEGKQALTSPDTLVTYLSTTNLSPEQQQEFLNQPLDRLQQYEYMVEANVRDVVEGIYPFCQKVLGDAWDAVYQDYFCNCPSHTYSLMGCAEAFPGYLESREDLLQQFPYLGELALYEWIEAEILSAEDPAYPLNIQAWVPNAVTDLSLWSPVMNQTAMLLQFEYPIPEILEHLKAKENRLSPSFATQTELILVYRQKETQTCRYFQLTPVLASWLSLLGEASEPWSYFDSLQPVLTQLRQTGAIPSEDVFYQALLGSLPELLQQGVLCGSVSTLTHS